MLFMQHGDVPSNDSSAIPEHSGSPKQPSRHLIWAVMIALVVVAAGVYLIFSQRSHHTPATVAQTKAQTASGVTGAGLPVETDEIFVLRKQQAVEMPDFVSIQISDTIKAGTPPREATHATLECDQHALTVKFDCVDNGIVADQQGHDNVKLWKDDCVYIWLDPGHTHEKKNLIMVQVSAGGLVFDTRNSDPKYDIKGLLTDISRTKSGWSVRITMPWTGLEVPAPKSGEIWGINVSRMDQPGKFDYFKMEVSSLMTIPSGNLLETRQWGHFVYADDAAQPDDTYLTAAQKAITVVHVTQRQANVVDNTGVLTALPVGKDWRDLQAQVTAFPGGSTFKDAKDVKVTQGTNGKTVRGTIPVGDIPCAVTQIAAEEPDGTIRIELEVSAAKDIPRGGADEPCGIAYLLQIPITRFVKGSYQVGDKRGTIPTAWNEQQYRFYQGKTATFLLTDADGNTLTASLDHATEVSIQDSRKWSPNLHAQIMVNSDMLKAHEPAKITIRLKMTAAEK